MATPAITRRTARVDQILPDPRNPWRHGEKQLALLASSIERFGFVDAAVTRPAPQGGELLQLVGGEGRWLAAQRLNLVEIPVTVIEGLSELDYRKLGAALNKIPEGRSADEGLLAELIAELEADGGSATDVGFSEKEIKSYLSADEIEVKEIATGPVQDEFWISIRGPLAHQAIMLQRLEAAAKGLDNVTVDLGTIPIEM